MEEFFTAWQRNITSIISSLYWALVGALLVVFDFNVVVEGTTEISIDIAHDLIGYLLLLIAIIRLRRVYVDARYVAYMHYIAIALVLSMVIIIYTMIASQHSLVTDAIMHFSNILNWIALVVFGEAMRRLCTVFNLQESHRGWTITKWLLVAIYLVPFALFEVVRLFLSRSNHNLFLTLQIHTMPPFLIALVILTAIIPLVYIWKSTLRMRREAMAVARYYAESV